MKPICFTFVFAFSAVVLAAAPALAGPPLICHVIDIGAAKSLPWTSASGWDGARASYDLSHLTTDTLALLTPQTPIDVRRETLRRAAIYAAAQSGLADALSARLVTRASDADAAGVPNPTAWFDAGYFIETLRQAAAVYPMLRPEQRGAWMVRPDSAQPDGLAWIRRAIRMGGQHMQQAADFVASAREKMKSN